ncbi:MAG: PASTA domain-containing protein, partial [Eggerthella sp.]|nr:PASTA domain-containing protein [Eggerthella sp.]
DATSTLKNAGFEVSVKHMASGTVEKGYVISQDVVGKANKGSRVTITVSSGSA